MNGGYEPLLALQPGWADLVAKLQARLEHHGDYLRWRRVVDELPTPKLGAPSLGDTVTVSGNLNDAEKRRLRALLQELHPWRKGPFALFDIHIDSEWRSDFKWRRVAPHVNLDGRRVLDIGCGNGYFGWRMLAAGARWVIGIDPTVLFCMQHHAINHFVQSDDNWVLPLAFEDLDHAYGVGCFDTVFSMGVIYHRREPLEHLDHIRRCLVPGGQIVLESLVVVDPPSLTPSRYARMRNVWHVPTPQVLCHWLQQSGFTGAEIVDITPTTRDEQRSTDWMRFESLQESLDSENPQMTIEGHPAPTRCLITARTKS